MNSCPHIRLKSGLVRFRCAFSIAYSNIHSFIVAQICNPYHHFLLFVSIVMQIFFQIFVSKNGIIIVIIIFVIIIFTVYYYYRLTLVIKSTAAPSIIRKKS
jgi:hypothetical protein